MQKQYAKDETLLGGMALIEGVMMKSPHRISMAVRKPDGSVYIENRPYQSLVKRYRFLDVPFVRGSLMMVEMMFIGMRALNKSADISTGEEVSSSKSVSFLMLGFTVVVSLAIALLLFKFAPFAAAGWIAGLFPVVPFVITEGIIKAMVFLGYVFLIGFMPDIRRVFEYHGAEHMAIRCYESKKPLTVRNAEQCSRFHPRCGTSFVIFIILLSIVLYAFIPSDTGFWSSFGLRLLLLPVLAGVSYEILRFTARLGQGFLFKMISLPGMLTQRLTTQQPDKEQLAVALAALKESLKQ